MVSLYLPYIRSPKYVIPFILKHQGYLGISNIRSPYEICDGQIVCATEDLDRIVERREYLIQHPVRHGGLRESCFLALLIFLLSPSLLAITLTNLAFLNSG